MSVDWHSLHEAVHTIATNQDDQHLKEAQFLNLMKELDISYQDISHQIHSLHGWIELVTSKARLSRLRNRKSKSSKRQSDDVCPQAILMDRIERNKWDSSCNVTPALPPDLLDYQKFIQIFRENPKLIAEVTVILDGMKPTHDNLTTRSIILEMIFFSLFGNVFHDPMESQKFRLTLAEIFNAHAQKSEHLYNFLPKRSLNFGLELLNLYLRANRGRHGTPLSNPFSDIIRKVLENENADLEVDQELLEQLCSELVSALETWDLRETPDLIKLFGHVLHVAETRWPTQYGKQRDKIMYKLVFNYLLFPALREPMTFRLCSSSQMSSKGEQNVETLRLAFQAHLCASEAVQIVQALLKKLATHSETASKEDQNAIYSGLPTFDTVCISLSEMMVLHEIVFDNLEKLQHLDCYSELLTVEHLPHSSIKNAMQTWYRFEVHPQKNAATVMPFSDHISQEIFRLRQNLDVQEKQKHKDMMKTEEKSERKRSLSFSSEQQRVDYYKNAVSKAVDFSKFGGFGGYSEMPEIVLLIIAEYCGEESTKLPLQLSMFLMICILHQTASSISYLLEDDEIVKKLQENSNREIARVNETEFSPEKSHYNWSFYSTLLLHLEMLKKIRQKYDVPVSAIRNALHEWVSKYKVTQSQQWSKRRSALLDKIHRQHYQHDIVRQQQAQDRHLLFLSKVFYFWKYTEIPFHISVRLQDPSKSREYDEFALSDDDEEEEAQQKSVNGSLRSSSSQDINSSFEVVPSSGSINSNSLSSNGKNSPKLSENGSEKSQPSPKVPVKQSRNSDGAEGPVSGEKQNQEPNECTFFCKTVDGFIQEYTKSHSVLKRHPKEFATIWHQFLARVNKRCAEQKSFKANERTPLVELIEKHIMTKLYLYVFPSPMDSLNEAIRMDRKFYKKVTSLDWVDPFRDLGMEWCPKDNSYWDIPVQEILSLDRYKCPKDKLICLSNTLKWCVKKLELGMGHTPGADQTLPAIVWVIILAKPASLQANLSYIQTFRRSEQMMSIEGYSHAQITQAYLFILNTLEKRDDL